jgi:hypothetical protein
VTGAGEIVVRRYDILNDPALLIGEISTDDASKSIRLSAQRKQESEDAILKLNSEIFQTDPEECYFEVAPGELQAVVGRVASGKVRLLCNSQRNHS